MQQATCPSRAQLSAFVLGKLPDLALKQVAEHSSNCVDCQRVLQSLDVISDPLIQQIRQQRLQKIAPELAELLKKVEVIAAELNTLTPGNTVAGHEVKLTQEVQQVLAPPQGPAEIGRLGKYRVLKLLGQGGMGMVFQAEDPHLQRAIALKVMLPALAANAAAKERFLREARATAAIEHDHIVTIHQVDEDRGVPYLAMQMLKGMSLEDYLKRAKDTKKPLTLGQILKLGRETARGLAAAHERGLIHRDIKPANVWLDATAGGRVKILDFGLARPAEADSSITQSGMIVGTPAYMAPEQAQGKPVDGRADLFSLGVVLYRLCSGRMPWKGENAMATLMAVATEEPVPVQELNPDLPPPLANLVMQLLAKSPAGRPRSATAVVEAIQAIEREQAAGQTGKTVALAVPVESADASAWQNLTQEGTAALVQKPVPPRNSSRRALWVVASLVVGVALVLVAGAVIYVKTDTGTLQIETADADVQVIVEQAGQVVQVLDKKTGTVVKLQSGEYRLKLGNENKDVMLDKGVIKIKRGELVVATIQPTREAANRAACSDNLKRIGEALHKWDQEQGRPPVLRPLPGQGSNEAIGEVRRFAGHKGEIYSVALSPDGRRAVTTGADSTIRIWDVATGKQLRFWEHLRLTTQAIFGDSGRKVWCGVGMTTPEKSGVLLFDAETGKELQRGIAGDTWAAGLALSGDDSVGLSTGFGNDVLLWDMKKPGSPRHLMGHDRWVLRVAITPDGKTGISCTQYANQIVIWDLTTGKEKRRLTNFTEGVYGLAVSHDGQRLLSAGRDGIVRLWDINSGVQLRSYPGHTGPVLAVAFANDGRRFVSGGDDHLVLLWDVDKDQPIHRFTGHGDKVNGVAYAADGQHVLSGSKDGTVRWWRVANQPSADAWIRSVTQLRQAGLDGRVRLLEGHTDLMGAVAISPDNRRIASGNNDHSARLWDADTGKELRSFEGHLFEVTSVAFTADGKRLFSGNKDGTARLWDTESGKELRKLEGHTRWIWSVAISPDGSRALSCCSGDGDVRLWDLPKGEEIRRLEGHQPDVKSVAFSPDGRQALSAGNDGTLRLWDLATGKEVRALAGHIGPVRRVVFSADGRQALSGGYDNTMRLWDLQTGKEIRPFQGHTGWVQTVAFAPDGRHAVSGSWDETIRVWDLASGMEVARLEPKAGRIEELALSSDGRFLVLASWDKAVRIVRLTDTKIPAEGSGSGGK
jgi:WD40 repeat protein